MKPAPEAAWSIPMTAQRERECNIRRKQNNCNVITHQLAPAGKSTKKTVNGTTGANRPRAASKLSNTESSWETNPIGKKENKGTHKRGDQGILVLYTNNLHECQEGEAKREPASTTTMEPKEPYSGTCKKKGEQHISLHVICTDPEPCLKLPFRLPISSTPSKAPPP